VLYGDEERVKMLLVGAKLHGGGGPAVKRRGRRRGGLGGEREVEEREGEETMKWRIGFAGVGAIYIPTGWRKPSIRSEGSQRLSLRIQRCGCGGL